MNWIWPTSFYIECRFVRSSVIQFDAIIYFSRKFPSYCIDRYAIHLIVLVQNNQKYGHIERDLDKNRNWYKTKVIHANGTKTNVRIQVKPQLNKFHIFLRFHIVHRSPAPLLATSRNIIRIDDVTGWQMNISFFGYGTHRPLSCFKWLRLPCLSHVPKSFSLNFTLPEQRKKAREKKEATQSL